jgi:Holliday junction resolvasome RuvABC endonuclease subunit
VRLLALDQASRTSGYAIFDDDELIDYGTFTYDDEDIGIRLHKIRNKVEGLIDRYSIDYVVFEDIQMQGNVVNNVQTFKILAEVFGVIYELVTSLGLDHDAVLSSSWKSTLGIKGRTRPDQKKNAQAYVVNTYGVKPS